MTTHYEKIQALGNRMASNLETMGVSASFGDGGLTLADKILQIQHFTNGLLLYADKNIIQIDDTVNVYALLLDERKAVSGETIFFRGLETTQTLVANTETSVGNQYRFTNLPSSSSDWGNGKVYLNEEQTAYLHHNGDNIMLFANNRGYPISNNISIENGIITCYDSQTSYKHTIDISSTNTNKITSTISDVTITETMQGTTGSDGVATVSYTGKGAGVLNIKAVHGIIQSETYSIIDAFFKNVGIGTDDNTNYYNPSSRVTVSVDATGKTLTQNGGTTGQYYAVPIGVTPSSASDSSFDVDFIAEFDLVSFNEKTAYLRCGDFYRSFRNLGCTGGEHIRYEIKNGSQKIFVDNSEVPSYSGSYEMSNSNVFFTVGTDASMKFKNFIIYPI